MSKSAMTEFQKFLVETMQVHGISQNELGAAIGLSSGGISKYMKPAKDNKVTEPSLHVLASLAQFTKHNLIDLIKMAYPDIPKELLSGLPPRVQIIAERFNQLSTEQQEVLDSAILGMLQTINKAKKNI